MGYIKGVYGTFVKYPLSMGESGSEISYTAGNPVLSIYATNAGTSGSTSAEPFYLYSVLTGAGQVGGRSRFHTYSNVVAGGWVNSLKSYMEFGSSGGATGLASSICCEMLLPDRAIASGAAASYYPLEIELGVPASCDLTGGPTGAQAGFIYMNAYTTPGEFDDHGYLFYLDGVTGGDGHVFDNAMSEDTSPAINATLKININGTEWWIPLSDTKDCS